MKDNRICIGELGDDIFLSTLLVCCAWGKIEWHYFWLVWGFFIIYYNIINMVDKEK